MSNRSIRVVIVILNCLAVLTLIGPAIPAVAHATSMAVTTPRWYQLVPPLIYMLTAYIKERPFLVAGLILTTIFQGAGLFAHFDAHFSNLVFEWNVVGLVMIMAPTIQLTSFFSVLVAYLSSR